MRVRSWEVKGADPPGAYNHPEPLGSAVSRQCGNNWPNVLKNAVIAVTRSFKREGPTCMVELAKLPWNEVKKVDHYWLSVDAVCEPMQVREDTPPYGG